MKIVQFKSFGKGHEVANVVEVDDPGAPGDGEVLVDVEAFPINPVDLLTIAGTYASRPELPAIPGSEGLGKVVKIGPGVTQVKPGDRVLLMGRENWMQRKRVKAGEILPIHVDADPLQLSMLKINPATALLMLKRYRDLAAGDWLIQNAANSGVGSILISLAKADGVRTVNVVRREELVAPLLSLGADVVLIDGPDLAARVREATEAADIALGVDAVAGNATGRMAECLAEGGVVVNYGLLSGKPCAIDPHQVIFRQIDLTGFWLVKHLGAMSNDERVALYSDLGRRIAGKALEVKIAAVYEIDDIKMALEHAAREARGGKVLVTPNGPLS
ncbi:MAG TPA: zinc-dependent alcohol dehydrogenase family protein [Gammaproteobacteria bacterium]|nr:zinc-dependent alcohol dehydrogenase family protein [Gammaproteobacteria bacterium]